MGVVLLLFGASSVYALTGGYSLDTRKKYPLVALCLLMIGWVYHSYLPNLALGGFSLAVVIFLGVLTTWTVIGVWRYEERRYHSLVTILINQPRLQEIRLESDRDLYKEWPKLEPALGFRFDDEWVVNLALSFNNRQPIRKTSNAPVLLHYGASSQWETLNDDCQ